MTEDSQAGTAVAREEKTEVESADEERLLAEFEEEWARIRPAKVIARLGLDF